MTLKFSKSLYISGCDYTGNMVRPWAEAGHPCICVDIRQEREREEFPGGGYIEYVQADLHDYLPEVVKVLSRCGAAGDPQTNQISHGGTSGYCESEGQI